MRPVNLIPEEERRVQGGAGRTGPLAFIVVGALAALLIGVVMMVLAANEVSERKEEISTLTVQKEEAAARAAALSPYATFQQVARQRTQTVSELADSRFDWDRVIRQLSLVLPSGVWLTNLTGSAGGGAGEGSSSSAAGSVAGPSLSMSGCAPSQDGVAALVAALKEIDGVTRVGLESSTLASGEVPGAGETATCKGPQFSLLVAFDAAPPSPDTGAAVEESPTATSESSAGSEEGGTTASSTSTTPAG